MRTQIVLLCLALACLSSCLEAKTVFRRKDKISENFKQLDLPDEEIDPNVAPEPQKVETLDPEDVIVDNSSDIGTLAPTQDEVIDEADDSSSATAAEVIDEATNEVAPVVAAVAAAPTAVAAPVAAPVATVNSAASPAVAAATTPVKNEDDSNTISKYCKCTDSHCDCCRNFNLSLIPVRGPGCAKITYLGNEKMSVSLKYGDITLATRTISGKNAKPICVGLPGGFSKFCGRVYGLSKAKENFKACLGFELRAEDEVEAALRVSCFKFGPQGLRVAEAEPLPSEVVKEEDDDDDDIFGFAAGGDEEDEEDEDDYDGDDDADETDDYEDDDDAADEAPEDADYGGFSLGGLLDELADDDEETNADKPLATPVAGVVSAAVTPTIGQTRTHVAQSKDDKGTEAGAAAVDATAENAVAVSAVDEVATTAVTNVTPVDDAATTATTTKKGKKAKKNKKKKAAAGADGESDFAFQIINGLLDFFN